MSDCAGSAGPAHEIDDDGFPDVEERFDDHLDDEPPWPDAPHGDGSEVARALRRLALALGACVALGLSFAWIGNETAQSIVVVVLLFVSLPVIVVAWFDVARALHGLPTSSRNVRFVRVLAALPQAGFGVLALTSGLGIAAWVLYNSFVERLPEYRGGFLTFGISFALVSAGWFWLRGAFAGHGRDDLDVPPLA